MQNNRARGSLSNVLERLNLFGDHGHGSAVINLKPATRKDRGVVVHHAVRLAEYVRPRNYFDRTELIFELKQTEAIALLCCAQVQVNYHPAQRDDSAMTKARQPIDIGIGKIL